MLNKAIDGAGLAFVPEDLAHPHVIGWATSMEMLKRLVPDFLRVTHLLS